MQIDKNITKALQICAKKQTGNHKFQGQNCAGNELFKHPEIDKKETQMRKNFLNIRQNAPAPGQIEGNFRKIIIYAPLDLRC